MSKKIFCPNFSPAELVKGSDRWYIRFYAKEKGILKRYRITFDLNRITNLKQRELRAQDLISKINWWLSRSKPAKNFREESADRLIQEENGVNALESTNIISAIQFALDIKRSNLRPESIRTYSSAGNIFMRWLRENHLADFSISQFSKKNAMAYMDHCSVKRKVSGITYNNIIQHMRSIFSELVKREYVKTCPFKEVPFKTKLPPKKRRNFTTEEARIVLSELKQREPLLFLAVLLEYCCFLRPNEIRSLRFRDFNLKDWTVFISFDRSKDWENRYVTIPKAFQKHFDVEFLKQHKLSDFVFGQNFAPHPEIQCTKHDMYRCHKRVLQNLKSRGVLNDITGLQLYSWKDTGITNALEQVSIIAVQEQAGHSSPDITIRYRHKKKQNELINTWEDELII